MPRCNPTERPITFFTFPVLVLLLIGVLALPKAFAQSSSTTTQSPSIADLVTALENQVTGLTASIDQFQVDGETAIRSSEEADRRLTLIKDQLEGALASIEDSGDIVRIVSELSEVTDERISNAREQVAAASSERNRTRWADRVTFWQERQERIGQIRAEIFSQGALMREHILMVDEERAYISDLYAGDEIDEALMSLTGVRDQMIEINAGFERMLQTARIANNEPVVQ